MNFDVGSAPSLPTKSLFDDNLDSNNKMISMKNFSTNFYIAK